MEGKTMSTWLMDTPLLKMLRLEKAKPLLHWCEANDASLFISAASLAHVAQGIDKLPTSQSQGAKALRNWLDRIIDRFGDRIHPVDAAIAMRAGSLLPCRTVGLPIHHFHDVLLVATAQKHGHGLVTRRDPVFGPWTGVKIAIV
jgi:predicted nucleic acid-binding protein